MCGCISRGSEARAVASLETTIESIVRVKKPSKGRVGAKTTQDNSSPDGSARDEPKRNVTRLRYFKVQFRGGHSFESTFQPTLQAQPMHPPSIPSSYNSGDHITQTNGSL